jgi:hypothetical protein
VGTRQEPTFDAAAIEVLTYYRSPHTPATQYRSFVLTIGLITFVSFAVALTTLLRRAEGEAPWRSAIAMDSGVLFVALVLSGNEVAAAFRADDLDPQIARYAFDEGQAAFAKRPGGPWQFRQVLRLGYRHDWIPSPLGGMAGHRKRSGARTQPDQLDQLHLAAALRNVLAVGDHGGHTAPAPQLPRRRPVRLNPVQFWFMSLRGCRRGLMILGGSCSSATPFGLTGEPLSEMLAPSTRAQ